MTTETRQPQQMLSAVTVIWALRSIIQGYGTLLQPQLAATCLEAFKRGDLDIHFSDCEIKTLNQIIKKKELPLLKSVPAV